MMTASQLAGLRTASIDYEETQRLKEKLRRLKTQRQPFYLTGDEFDEILKWKLRKQYGRQKKIRAANTDNLIRHITGAVLNLAHPDKGYEIDLRINCLCCLRGVGIPVASAILALVFPDDYAVIDFRGWRQVFGAKREAFSLRDYRRYLREIARFAGELGWSVQEVDLAIWEYDRRLGG